MAAKKFLKRLSLASASLGNMIHIFWFLCRECVCLGSGCCLVWSIHLRCQTNKNPQKHNKLLSLCKIFNPGRHLHLSAECSHPHRSPWDPAWLETIHKDPQNSQMGSRAFFLPLWLLSLRSGLCEFEPCCRVWEGWVLPSCWQQRKRIQNPLPVISRINSVVWVKEAVAIHNGNSWF